MKNKYLLGSILGAICFLFIVTATQTGCQSTPNRIAYNTTSITAKTVNATVQGWWDYKRAFPGKVSVEQDAKVKAAYEKYQTVMKASSDAYEAYLLSPADATAWQQSLVVSAAVEADLITLINQFKGGK